MKLIGLLLAFLVLFISGCGGSSDGDATPPPAASDISNRIYVLAAGEGSTAGSDGNDYTITLDKVHAEVDWYTDRPQRDTGDEATTDFINASWARVYADTPPNALLHYRNASGMHALFGAVRNVAYDARAGTLQFTLSLDDALDNPASVLGSFETPVLTLLNNLKPPAQGSSFALPAGQASFVTNEQGQLRLVVANASKDVFWMSHAPSRGGDFESLGNFINYWPERFADSEPNASLAGDLGRDDYDIVLLTLSDPIYDLAGQSVSFAAEPLRAPGSPDINTVLKNAVLFVDAGERSSPSAVFDQPWRGIAYSAIPAQFNSNPTGAFFDSDLTAANFQAVWGQSGGCGRNDLQTMADAGVNLVRLYDYNYQRGSTEWTTAGDGHIPFLDLAQSLGIKVIIPVSNYNFMDEDPDKNRPWDNIQHTVTQIVQSTRKNGVIHPAVHSFSVGNELDLPKYGMDETVLIPRALQVAALLHQLAPDHYITIPVSTADEKKFYDKFRNELPASFYQSRFYNAVQTFKLQDDLRDNILRAYDESKLGVPLVITELGTHGFRRTADYKVDSVLSQASVVRNYMNEHPDTLVKGFAIFEWQNSNWKRGGTPADNSESSFGIHAYGGTLCSSTTGRFYMEGTVNGQYVFHEFHPDVSYNVDQLLPLTSSSHPNGLLKDLSVYFK